MCIIIYAPDGHVPRKHLRRGLAHNPDGWGFMVHDGAKVVIDRGLTVEEFWPKWEARAKGPVVFHARRTSHGKTNLANCHPFTVPGHGLAVCHNGIIAQHAFRDSELSDTRLFVRDVLAGLPQGFLDNPAIRTLIEDYVGRSRLVFMDVTGKVTILNEQVGHWAKGRWYSNGSYRPDQLRQSLPTFLDADAIDEDACDAGSDCLSVATRRWIASPPKPYDGPRTSGALKPIESLFAPAAEATVTPEPDVAPTPTPEGETR